MLDHSHGVCIIVSATRRVELSAFNSPRQVAGSSAELLTVKAESDGVTSPYKNRQKEVGATVTHRTPDHTSPIWLSGRLCAESRPARKHTGAGGQFKPCQGEPPIGKRDSKRDQSSTASLGWPVSRTEG